MAGRTTPEAQERKRLSDARYRSSEKGRATRRQHGQTEQRKAYTARYRASEAGKAAQLRANKTEKARARQERYFASPKGQEALRRKRQSELGRATDARARHKRRMTLAGLSVVTAAEWATIQAQQNGECAYCLRRLPLTMEHIHPLSLGGQHTPENVVGACRSCNSSKRAQTLGEWVGI
jgi:5-methylcytosine-specific restriction endonuclease McrA